jgi:enamine deaminase RidA (YjgF/YER057c/UK114 family)
MPRDRSGTAESRLAALGIVLPEIPSPAGNYSHCTRSGNQLFLSAKGSTSTRGKVGDEVSLEAAYAGAREVGLILLAVMRRELGTLDKVKQVLKLYGMVNAEADFADHPSVVNGCSDLLVEVFGERGRHARSAVGMGSLPGNMSVAIDAVVEVEE